MLPAQPNRSLINGLACLQAVVTSDKPVGSREVARLLTLEHTRVHRLLGTLCHLGVVEKTAARKFRPGPGLHVLSAQSLRGSGLLGAAIPHLQPLAKEKLTIAMGVLWGNHVCYLIHTRVGQRPERGIGGHALYPAHESIMGPPLLAQKTDEELRELYFGDDEPAISDENFEKLMDEVSDVRELGYCYRRNDTGKAAIAFSVCDPPIASISVTGPIGSRRVPRLIETLGAIAEAITADVPH